MSAPVQSSASGLADAAIVFGVALLLFEGGTDGVGMCPRRLAGRHITENFGERIVSA
jgi:hypothetical protein